MCEERKLRYTTTRICSVTACVCCPYDTMQRSCLFVLFLFYVKYLIKNYQEYHQVRPRHPFTHKLHQQPRSVVSAIRGSQHSVAENMAWNEFDCIITLYESACTMGSTGTSEPFSLQLAFLLEVHDPGFTVGVHAGLEDCSSASCNVRDLCASIPRSAAHFFSLLSLDILRACVDVLSWCSRVAWIARTTNTWVAHRSSQIPQIDTRQPRGTTGILSLKHF